MERKAGFCLTGALVALSLSALPALAQNNPPAKDWQPAGRPAPNMWSIPEDSEIIVLQALATNKFTKDDLMTTVRFLQDLQAAKDVLRGSASEVKQTLLKAEPGVLPDMTGPDSIELARQMYRDKHEKIWATLNEKLGADKAISLQRLVEPIAEDSATFMIKSARMQRIDTLMIDLNRMVDAHFPELRSTVTTVSEERTTQGVDLTPPIVVYSTPTVRLNDLIEVVKLKIVSMEADKEALFLYEPNRPLTWSEMRFLREESEGIWK